MRTYFELFHRFKNSMLEITSEIPVEYSWQYLTECSKDKLPDGIDFSVATGKKAYDIIRFFERGEYFYSQRIINVFSQFIDMSDKCYPIIIKNVDMQYYVIYNLYGVPWINRKENTFCEEPNFIDASNTNVPIFCIENTGCFIVTEEVKDALFDNKITNISLKECFSCLREGYERIKKTGIWPEVHSFADRQNNRITTEYYRL